MTRRPFALLLSLVALLAVALLPAAGAQTPGPSGVPDPPAAAGSRQPMVQLQLYSHTLLHQRARDALQVVLPLLSSYGRVEIQPGGNSLLIRDTPAAMARVLPALWQFDHPARGLRLELHLVRATASSPGAAAARTSAVPPEILARLRKLLPFDGYQLLDTAQVQAKEGDAVGQTLAGAYKVTFRLGTVLDGKRVRIGDFRLVRAADSQELVRANLNLPFAQTLVLAATREAGSPRALLLVLKGELVPERAARGGTR